MVSFENALVYLSPDGVRRLKVTLHLNAGDVGILVGPNGCGKTTILDVIVGLRRLQEGRLHLDRPGEPIAYAVQDPNSGLLPWRTIGANITLPAVLHPGQTKPETERVLQLLESFRLKDRRQDFPYRLSGGEKQAVNLIRTLCTPCQLALLDEVLGPLHHDLRALAKRELAKWLVGKTAVLVTHDVDDLDLPFNRFFTIADSTLIEIDSVQVRRTLTNAV